jgi:hypothetical protein
MNFFLHQMVFLSIGRGPVKGCALLELRKERLTGVKFFWSAIGNCIHFCQFINKEALANF